MMDKEKQIEEIAKDLCSMHGGHCGYDNCGFCFGEKDKYVGCKGDAEILVTAGYRKESEDAEEKARAEKAEAELAVYKKALDDIAVKFDELGFEPTTLVPPEMHNRHFKEWFAVELKELKQ